MQPPPLPSAVLMRVARIARIDGWSILIFTGTFALLSAQVGDRFGAVLAVLVAGGGAMEIHGEGLLRHANATGVRWLIGSQLYILVVMLAYCFWRLNHVDLTPMRLAVTPDLKEKLETVGYEVDDFLRMVYHLVFVGVALATILYQGGMAFYYLRRSGTMRRAVEDMSEYPTV